MRKHSQSVLFKQKFSKYRVLFRNKERVPGTCSAGPGASLSRSCPGPGGPRLQGLLGLGVRDMDPRAPAWPRSPWPLAGWTVAARARAWSEWGSGCVCLLCHWKSESMEQGFQHPGRQDPGDGACLLLSLRPHLATLWFNHRLGVGPGGTCCGTHWGLCIVRRPGPCLLAGVSVVGGNRAEAGVTPRARR